MSGTFSEGVDRLLEHVGEGSLVGKVKVDQVYAAYQHFHPEFHHPDGGKAYYLRDPLYNGLDRHMQKLADGVLGHGVRPAMKDVTEDLVKGVYDEAPLEFGDLKGSGHPTVEDNGATYFDRPPNVPRLTEEELRIKGELRNLFEPDRYRRGRR